MTTFIGSTEKWIPAHGWDGLYEVSDIGRVRSMRSGRVLKPWINKVNRPWVRLYDTPRVEDWMVHRLVGISFHGPPPAGKEFVLHWDDNPLNNSAGNLRWGDAQDNSDDKRRLGTYESMRSVNRGKTHCPEGHPYSEENTRVSPRTGHRTCRTCRRLKYYDIVKEGLPENDRRHGTANGYANFRCRCAPCREAYQVYSRSRRKTDKAPALEGNLPTSRGPSQR